MHLHYRNGLASRRDYGLKVQGSNHGGVVHICASHRMVGYAAATTARP